MFGNINRCSFSGARKLLEEKIPTDVYSLFSNRFDAPSIITALLLWPVPVKVSFVLTVCVLAS